MNILHISQIDEAIFKWSYDDSAGLLPKRVNFRFGDSFSIFVELVREEPHISISVLQTLPYPHRSDILNAAMFMYKMYLKFEQALDDFNEDIETIEKMMQKIPSKKDREFMIWHLPGKVEVLPVREPQARMYQGETGCVYNSDAAHPFVLLDLAAMFVYYCNQWEDS